MRTISPQPKLSSSYAPSFGHTTKVLKDVLKALDQEQVSIVFNNHLLHIPELTKIWEKAPKNMFFTHNMKLSNRINDHWFFQYSKAKQLTMAESMILRHAKKDGTEAIITDLDGVVFNEKRKFHHHTNPKKAFWFAFLTKSKLVNRVIKHSVKIYDKLDIKWLTQHDLSIHPYVAQFINTMQKNNIKVFGLSGRPHILKQFTFRNLHQAGLRLENVFIKNGHDKTIAGDYRDFKIGVMQDLSSKYKILGMLGDNKGDLLPHNKSGFNLENIKETVQVLLSNPFYKTKFHA